jgi:hypothetical protein
MSNNAPTDNRGGNNQADLSQDTSGINLTDAGQQDAPEDRGGGEREYEAVFAPQRLNGTTSSEDIVLAPDVSDEDTREGEFSDNEAGVVTVPYNEVFDSYFNQANTAMDNSRIPLGLRDIVRQYFTSLAPNTATNNDD